MRKEKLTFELVENKIRKKTFGILSSIDENDHSHSTGIIYGVAPPNVKFKLYILTDKNYKKVKNIKNNNSISFVIPFPHYIIRFVPASCVQFQGTAKILPFDNEVAQESFRRGSKILKMNLREINNISTDSREAVFIEVIPNKKLYCYGLGINLLELRKNIESGSYIVRIPDER
jgi:general stress protein 26